MEAGMKRRPTATRTDSQEMELRIALQDTHALVRAAWDRLEALGSRLFEKGDPTKARAVQLKLADVRRDLEFAQELCSQNADRRKPQ